MVYLGTVVAFCFVLNGMLIDYLLTQVTSSDYAVLFLIYLSLITIGALHISRIQVGFNVTCIGPTQTAPSDAWKLKMILIWKLHPP